MIIVSYYTKNTPYEDVMKQHLLASLKKWNLKYDVEAIGDFGNWQQNTHYKAKFIKRKLLQHKKPVVLIDEDAKIKKSARWRKEKLLLGSKMSASEGQPSVFPFLRGD